MDRAKVRWSQLKVGLMALGALVILSLLIFLMSGSQGFFDSKTDTYTYMDDSNSIAEGSDVRLNGILVGKVAHVDLSGMPDPNRTVRITMEIKTKYLPAIPVDSIAGP